MHWIQYTKSLTIETELLHSWNSYVGYSDLIHDKTCLTLLIQMLISSCTWLKGYAWYVKSLTFELDLSYLCETPTISL